MNQPRSYHIAVLPGDGVGPEVTAEVMRVLKTASVAFRFGLSWEEYLMGGAAIDERGTPLPDDTLEACQQADAVFLGAVGGPKWDHHTGDMRPESGLLKLRKTLQVFANLRPVMVPQSLAVSSPLREEVVSEVDLLVVRELTGGIYFGEPKGINVNGNEGFNTMRYRFDEIERVARVAFAWAQRRQGRVTSVDKANVLAVSQLWRSVVTDLQAREYQDIELTHLYVDNAAMQLVRAPRQFDVILTGNLFGDILSDLAATLPGSLGMLPSASVGGRVGLFEPVHGSAPDIAGQGKANPIAAILSGAMLLDELGEADAAAAIRRGVSSALRAGYRTADLWREDCKMVDTATLGKQIAQTVASTAEVVTE